ncbi:transcription elongation factor SPT6-like, partial [Pseudonaja textilis]|uniref:transcription elongation factor SPT6-like n=1 Tax=Pseudonaja textilis TaxID=8673 RepID=UPI000EA9FEC2
RERERISTNEQLPESLTWPFLPLFSPPCPGVTPSSSSRTRTPASINATPANINLADLTRAVNTLPQNMTSQMFSAIAAVTGQGQNANATPAQWASSQYGYGGSGGGSSAYHVSGRKGSGPHPRPLAVPHLSWAAGQVFVPRDRLWEPSGHGSLK